MSCRKLTLIARHPQALNLGMRKRAPAPWRIILNVDFITSYITRLYDIFNNICTPQYTFRAFIQARESNFSSSITFYVRLVHCHKRAPPIETKTPRPHHPESGYPLIRPTLGGLSFDPQHNA